MGRDGDTITEVRSVVPDMHHKGGGHFDVWYINECGKRRKQRFHRGGKPFTEAEHEALVNPGSRRRGRSGFTRVRALASILGTSVILVGVGQVYDKTIDLGWTRGIDLATKIGLGYGLQLADGMNALPGDRFDVIVGGRTIHVRILPDSPGRNYITAWYDGEVDFLIGVGDNYRVYNVDYDIPPLPLTTGPLQIQAVALD